MALSAIFKRDTTLGAELKRDTTLGTIFRGNIIVVFG
jgi:hypothetical protein